MSLFLVAALIFRNLSGSKFAEQVAQQAGSANHQGLLESRLHTGQFYGTLFDAFLPGEPDEVFDLFEADRFEGFFLRDWMALAATPC